MKDDADTVETAEQTTHRELIDTIKARYSEQRCTDVQQLLSIMANPIRFRILCALREHPFTVAELVDITESGLSNISQQLKMMWLAGYVAKERRGKQVVYSLNDERVGAAIDVLESMFPRQSYGDADGCED